MNRGFIYNPVNELFFDNGFAPITMQMVAEKLKISKKTLYKHYSNKEGLIAYILSERNRDFRIRWDYLKKRNENILLLSLKMRNFITEEGINEKQQKNLKELKLAYPKIYDDYFEELKATVEYCINDAILIGQREGVYLDYLNSENIAKLVTGFYMKNRINTNEIYDKEEFAESYLNFYFLIMRGCLTLKGLKTFNTLEHEIYADTIVSSSAQ